MVVAVLLVAGCGRDGASHAGTSDAEATPVTTVVSVSLPEDSMQCANPPPSGVCQRSLFVAPQLHHCSNTVAERSNTTADGGGLDKS